MKFVVYNVDAQPSGVPYGGRKRSAWGQYDARQQAKKRKENWEEVAAGKMPPWSYTIVHPEARLSAADLSVLRAWAQETADGRHSQGKQ